MNFIRTSTLIMDIERLAGEINIERGRKIVRGLVLSGSIIPATSRKENAKAITGDKHFADLKN